MVTEQYERIEQQVIKIHGVALAAALLIALVYLAHHRYALKLVMLVDIGILNVARCRYQAVLGIADTVLDHTGLIGLVIQLHILDNGLDQVLAVLLVIDGKVGGVAYLIGLRAQNTAEYAVERTHPEITGTVLSHSRCYALFHLSCRLVGKGQGQYGPWLHSLLQQMGNLVCEYTCFSGTGTGYYHAVAICIEDGVTLAGIEFLLVVYHMQSFITRNYKIREL